MEQTIFKIKPKSLELIKKFFKYVGLTLGAFVVFYVVWMAFWLWYQSAEDELHILPNTFEGCVIILFNEPNGEAKEYNEDGDRVYRIPKNGILKTQFKHEEGWRHDKYIRENKQKIRYLGPADKVWDDTTNVHSAYKDSIYAYLTRYSSDVWYIVGKPKDIGKWNREMTEKWKTLY